MRKPQLILKWYFEANLLELAIIKAQYHNSGSSFMVTYIG